MTMCTLVIAAHPDDEVLGCGGTIARLADEGHDIFVAILGEGMTSRYPENETTARDALNELHGRSREAANLIGAKDLFLYQLPDNRFDTVPLLEIVKKVEALVERLKPTTIYTHHSGDLNIDHVVTHRAVLTATRPVAGCPVKSVYAFEVPSSTEWGFGQLMPIFQPNAFIDIHSTLEIKLDAMEIYGSESQPFPHPRSREALRAIARRWGSVVGLQAAEAFELIRAVK